MAFTVPDSEPVIATGLVAGDTIAASSMRSILKRDRYLFATRRRLIASLPKVTTSVALFENTYSFRAKLLPTSTDTITVGVVATDDCSVRIATTYGNVIVTTGGPGSYIDVLSGIPQATWFTITVQVQSNTGGSVTIHGIYISELILTDADLP